MDARDANGDEPDPGSARTDGNGEQSGGNGGRPDGSDGRMDGNDDRAALDSDLDAVDGDLYRRTKALLEPGDIELNGVVVHTDLDGQQDVEMMEATLEVGDVVAERAGRDPDDTYVYSGNDDAEFSSNQHQGLTIDGDEFVWECQQLLRDGSFDLVFYYEASADHDGILDDLRAAGYTVTGVEG